MNKLDTGFTQRMEILKKYFKDRPATLLESHGWSWNIDSEVEDGEYLLITISRNNYTKKLALLFAQQTNKRVYERLEPLVDACLVNGMSFIPNCPFSSGFNKPIDLLSNFYNILRDWNSECPLEQTMTNEPCSGQVDIPSQMYFVAENPSEQCWMLIKSLRSIDVCKRIITNRFKDLPEEVIKEKATGIAFSIQNACDYFDIAPSQNTTQRMLSLYYGSLAFIEADILMNSNDYTNLKSVEDITKDGHGLFVFLPNESYDISNLNTGLLNKGLFYQWLKMMDYEVENYPKRRVKSVKDLNEYCYPLNDLLNRIPEIAFLMRMIDSNYKTGFFKIYQSYKLNAQSGLSKLNTGYKPNNTGTYLNLVDESHCSNLEMVKTLIGTEQHAKCEANQDHEGKAYSIFVRHSNNGNDNWCNHLNTHHSSYFSNAILIPLAGLKDDWCVYAVMILYTFSIIVRYYPNLWRRIQFGEWDKYYTVCLQLVMIVEKVLPRIFYERITGQKLHISSPVYG